MSDDPKQEYFADGITDDLITELSKVSGLFVISRNSTFVYKGRTVPPKQVSEELGVRYVLEGSVQRAGDQLRINAQLIDALDGGHGWADRFDGSLADVFALPGQGDAQHRGCLGAKADGQRTAALSISRRPTCPRPTTPSCAAGSISGERRRRTMRRRFRTSRRRSELDPNYGRAYAALAMVYAHGSVRGWLGSLGLTAEEAFDKAKQYLQEARKQPTAMTHWVAGYILINGGAGAEALAEFREAAVLDPGDSWNYALIGFTLVSLGRSGEAIQYIDTAMRLDPRPPSLFMYYLGLSQFGMEQFDKAAASLESATKLNPDDQFPFLVLVASYGYLGRKQDAVTAIARYSDLAVKQGDVPVTIFDAPGLAFWPRIFWRVEDSRRLREGLLLAGMPMSILESEFGARNCLTFEEIHLLLLGHRVHGRDFWSGEERAASITTEGVVTLSGDWGTLDSGGSLLTGGILQFVTDELCYRFDFVSYCGTMFRNPGGTKANENEFFWYTSRGAMTFSQVE